MVQELINPVMLRLWVLDRLTHIEHKNVITAVADEITIIDVELQLAAMRVEIV